MKNEQTKFSHNSRPLRKRVNLVLLRGKGFQLLLTVFLIWGWTELSVAQEKTVPLQDSVTVNVAGASEYVYTGDNVELPEGANFSVLRRFLRYAIIDTTSNESSKTVPSSPGQTVLANMLVEELKELGMIEVSVDKCGFVTATLPSNLPKKSDAKNSSVSTIPTIGLIAHLDTSAMAPGKNVRPHLLRYQKGSVRLKSGVVIPEDEALRRQQGRWIVTTDGTTLLGGDNKAGIASIMTALERLIHEERPHGTVKVCFTPDEEIGKGITFLDLKHFQVDYAYTVTCGPYAQYNDETFTADQVILTIHGNAVHPGYAYGTLVNAVHILAEIAARLPAGRRPETTRDRQPYLFLFHLEGDVSMAKAVFLLRAFEEKERQKNFTILRNAVDSVRVLYPKARIDWEEKLQYRGIKAKIDKVPALSSKVFQAMKSCGITPVVVPVRGGTDGSWLTERGIPTPNLFAGYYRPHSVTEWLSVDELNKSSKVLVRLVELWGQK